MSAALAPERLRIELARRAWGQAELSQAAGLSAPTVRSALSGRPIAPRTLRKIAMALAGAPPLTVLDSILPTRYDKGT